MRLAARIDAGIRPTTLGVKLSAITDAHWRAATRGAADGPVFRSINRHEQMAAS
jgi:hypothetical protein